jgi:hypothetical protein
VDSAASSVAGLIGNCAKLSNNTKINVSRSPSEGAVSVESEPDQRRATPFRLPAALSPSIPAQTAQEKLSNEVDLNAAFVWKRKSVVIREVW